MRVKQAAIRWTNKVDMGDPEEAMEMDSPMYAKTAAVGGGAPPPSPRWKIEKSVIGGGLYLPLHSQIRRIRDEDSHVGEDMFQALSLFVANEYNNGSSDSQASKVALTRPILPASPLGGAGKTASNNKFAV